MNSFEEAKGGKEEGEEIILFLNIMRGGLPGNLH